MVKNETVIGIIGKTQGVSNESNPTPVANKMKLISPCFFNLFAISSSVGSATAGGEVAPTLLPVAGICVGLVAAGETGVVSLVGIGEGITAGTPCDSFEVLEEVIIAAISTGLF